MQPHAFTHITPSATQMSRWLCLLVALLAACSSSEQTPLPPTQVSLLITASPEVRRAAARVSVQAATLHAGTFEPAEPVLIELRAETWPLTVLVVPGPDRAHDGVIELIANALDGQGELLAQARLIARFSPEEQRVRELQLGPCGGEPVGVLCEDDPSCHGYSCLTCVDDVCARTPFDVDARPPPQPDREDAGQEDGGVASREGGAGEDASLPGDAGAADASSDAGRGDLDAGEGEGDGESCVGNLEFTSRYFAGDSEARAVLRGDTKVKLPVTVQLFDTGLTWRVANAMRMAGYEPAVVSSGDLLDGARLCAIDRELTRREKLFDASAAKLPNYRDNWAPDFNGNIPQVFAVHLFVSIFELFNTRGALPDLQALSNECVLSTLLPSICGFLANAGTVVGHSCEEPSATLLDPQRVQLSGLFGFTNEFRAIAAEELPVNPTLESTCSYAAQLVGAVTREIDARRPGHYDMQYARDSSCSGSYVDFLPAGSPFVYTGEPGMQPLSDFVSERAAGLKNELMFYYAPFDIEETVVTYVLFPEYFRARMASSEVLRHKYEFIRGQLFGGVEFTNPDLTAADYLIPDVASNFCSHNRVKRFRIEEIRPR